MCSAVASFGQLASGMMGFGASFALPGGTTASVVSNGAGSSTVLAQFGFTYTGGSHIAYLISQNLELQAGLGFGTVSFAVPTGSTAIESQSTMSVLLGGRLYMSPGAKASPYVNVGLSYTKAPTIKTSKLEVSANLIGVIAAVGAQGWLSESVSAYVQMGLGYNSGTITSTGIGTDADKGSSSNSVNTLSLGGSAAGICVYW